jgi:hypothetical protein
MNFLLLNPWMSANKLYFDLQFEHLFNYLIQLAQFSSSNMEGVRFWPD